jgi:4-hydroxy-2-oxoheptanedioate aldolase
MIGVMIESVEAVDRVDEIIALDGLDFVLFGPSDLSLSLGIGYPLPMSDERIEEPLERTIAAAKAHGKHVSLTAGNKAGMIKYAAMGVTMLEVSSDVEAVRTAWTETVQTAAELSAKA